jgi:ketosteroid isomerase-like protein
MQPTSVLPDWYAAALSSLASGDIDGWMSMFAPDAVHEFPFAPEGHARRLEGRDAIAAYMTTIVIGGPVRHLSYDDIRVREVGDETIIEAVGHKRRIADDTPLDIDYVWFLTVRDGLVTHFRDYMNPLQLMAR